MSTGAGADDPRVPLEALFTHVDEAVVAVDDTGTVVFASPAIRTLTGFPPDAVVGTPLLDYLHPDEHEPTIERLARWHGRDGVTAGPTVRARHAAGGWVDVSVEAVTGRSVVPYAAVITMRPAGEAAEVLQELHRRLANEDRLTRLASTFVQLPSHRLDDGIQAALAELGGLEGVDRVCLVLYADDRTVLHNTHEWVSPGIASMLATHGRIPWQDAEVLRRLDRHETVVVNDVDLLDGAWAAERAFWRSRATASVVAVPLNGGDDVAGFLGFEAVRERRDWDAHHLAAIRSGAGIISQALARWSAELELARQARRDALTGLANRWELLEAMERALAALPDAADGPAVALAVFDLDRFKVINDSLGHAAGDQLLVEVSRRFAAARRPQDVLARLGGDELVLLATGVTAPAEAVQVARSMQATLAEPVQLDGHETYVAASVGLAVTTSPSADPQDLLRDADAAMYEAKARGRNRVEVFDDRLRRRVRARLGLEHELRRALQRGELDVHYQPEVVLEAGTVVGAEALLRWHHPDRGLLPAAEFIDLAEDSGLILDIGAWVLQRACRQLGEWCSRYGDRPLLVRVNLSGRQVGQPDLVTQVVDAMAAAAVPPSALCLEITETTVMADAEMSLEVLEKLRGLGVELAIDDFGTGYSSLSYLKRLPVDVVKIDRSFVDGLGVDPDDTAIVTAIIGLARSLGLGVTAEGVETDVQRLELLRLGCGRAQGYLLGRPMAAEDFEALLARG